MNYLAAGIQQGWGTGASAIEANRRRRHEDQLEAARKSLQLETQARELQSRKLQQDADLTLRATLAQGGRDHATSERIAAELFGATEAEKNRAHGSGERIAAQGHQSTESERNRAAQALLHGNDLAQRAHLFGLDLPLRGAQLGLGMRHQAWLEDPLNPDNRIRETQARMNEEDLGIVTPAGGAARTGAALPAFGSLRPLAPPPAAIKDLRRNPQSAAYFEGKYGTGSASKYLVP